MNLYEEVITSTPAPDQLMSPSPHHNTVKPAMKQQTWGEWYHGWSRWIWGGTALVGTAIVGIIIGENIQSIDNWYHAPNRFWNPKPQELKEEISSDGFGQDDMDPSTWPKFEERSIKDWEKAAEQYLELHPEQSKRERHISKMNDTMIKERKMENDDRNIVYKGQQYRFAEVAGRWMPWDYGMVRNHAKT